MSRELVNLAPRLSDAEAAELTFALFNVQGRAIPLPSERDRNFYIATEDGAHYVLKIANAAEEHAVLALQNQAMAHLATRAREAGLAWQGPVALPLVSADAVNDDVRDDDTPDADAAEPASSIAVIELDGISHFVRLLTHVTGKPLALASPHGPELLTDLGAFLATMDGFLADFHHPAAAREFHWDLQHAAQVVTARRHALTTTQRDLVDGFLAHYQAATVPRLAALRKSVIHSDANDYNVLVTLDEQWTLRVAGIIDFGDMVYTHTVNEVAIGAAYAMLNKADPLSVAQEIVRGYHAVSPLTADELAVLYDLICMRLCVSVCVAAHQHAAAPDNAYLLISQAPIWRLLAQLKALHPSFAHYALRAACGLAPCPQTPAIMAYLSGQQADFAPVVAANLHTPDQLVLDLSVGSLMLDSEAAATQFSSLEELIQRQMAGAGVPVAIGRYDEARLLYATEQFDVVTNELPERRTLHLGLDLFMPAGSPVYAPLDGVVESVCHNAGVLDYGPTLILGHATDDGTPFFTLYGHLGMDVLARLRPGMLVAKGEKIGVIGPSTVNGGWPPHLHLQLITDLLEHEGNFPGVAAPGRRAVWTSLSPDPNVLLGIPAHAFPPAGRTNSDLLAARRDLLGRNLSISYRQPLKMVRGLRQFLYDHEGRAYLDVVNNVCHVGHCHPHVVRAGQQQLGVLNTNTRYLHDNIVDYAERLLATFPDPLNVVFFVCSGSEANELALRLARTYTNRQDIIMLDAAYHGNSQALVDISPYKHDGAGGRGAPPWAHAALMPDPYRGRYRGYAAQVGAAYAAHVKDLVDELAGTTPGVAAFIAESVLGCGGQIVLPDEYFAQAFAHVRAAGGVCIADEVQVGFGRVGSHFWGFETQGVVPDIVTMGKPIGNGHPLAAVVTTAEIADAFANGMEYFNTFGGNPVSCAIGRAVLEVIEGEELQQNAWNAGNRLQEGLRDLMARYPLMGDVRGLGLFVGAELVTDPQTLDPAPKHAAYIANRMRDHGILISTDGPLHNVLKMKPPIVFTTQDADRLVATLETILQEDCLQL